MTAKKDDQQDSITNGFEKILNNQGYGFQYAVINKVQELARNNESPWISPVPEFPVEVQGYGTRIDFVLRNKHHPYYLIAECKRANPSLSDWCFIKRRVSESMTQI